MRVRLCLGVLALSMFTACPAANPQRPQADPTQAWLQVSRRIEADPGDGVATLEAARLAVFARNDSEHAERLATQAAQASALRADANLLRTYLAWRRRDYAAVLDRATSVVEHDPTDDRAEVALWMLEWVSRDPKDFAPRIRPWLTDLLATRPTSPGVRRVGGRILLRLASVAKDVASYDHLMRNEIGALTRARSACPFGLFPALDWRRPQPPDTREGPLAGTYTVQGPAHRGAVKVRTRTFRDGWLRCDDWPAGGAVGYHEVDVEVKERVDALVTVQAKGSWRLDVNGQTLLTRDGLTQQLPGLLSRRVRLAAGWHRFRLKVATDQTRHEARIVLTDPTGRPVGRPWQGSDPPNSLAESTPLPREVDQAARRFLQADHLPMGARIERLLYACYLLQGRPLDDPVAARKAAEAIVALAPTSADGLYVLGEALESDESTPMELRRSRSRSLQRKVIELDPEHLLARYALGFSAQQDQRPESALPHFDRAIAINRSYYWAHYRRFEVLRDLGWDREARLSLERALELSANPTLLREASQWFSDRDSLGRRDALEDELERRLASLAPSLTAVRATRRGDHLAAMRAWAKRADVRPWAVTPWRRLFDAKMAMNRIDPEVIDRWTEASPFDPQLPLRRAEIAVMADRTPDAVAQLRHGLGLRPERLRDRKLLALLEGKALADTAHDARTLREQYDRAQAARPDLASWKDHEAVYLLDRRADRMWGRGGGWREIHRITLLQTKGALDAAGEWRPPNDATVMEMRTLKADGRVLEPELGQQKGDLSFSGLVPGDVIEVRYLVPIAPDYPGGGSHDGFYVRFNSRPVWKGELEVVIPKGERLDVVLRAGAPPPAERVNGNRRHYTWQSAAAAPIVSEPYQAPYAEWLPQVRYAYRAQAVAERRRDQLLDRRLRGAKVTAEVAQKAREIAGDLDHAHAQATALFRWIRDHVDARGRQARFLGHGAPAILATRSGNRALLLVAMLDALGIEHDLLVARGADHPHPDPPVPSLFHYTDPVVVVGELHLASRGDHALAGWLPEPLRGAEALQISEGPLILRRLPEVGGDSWTIRGRLRGDVGHGEVWGDVVVEGVGESTAALRRFLPRIPAAQRRQVVERALAPVLPGLAIESFAVSDLDDVDAPLRIDLGVRMGDAFDRTPGGIRLGRMFAAPMSSVLGKGVPPGRYLQRAQRHQTLMTRPLSEELDVTVEFDRPLRLVRAPDRMEATGPWGQVSQRWVEEGPRSLRLKRTLDIGIHRVAVADHPTFAEAMADIDRALTAEVRLQETP